MLRAWDTTDKNNLLHIMCGYQCDKAVNKNDVRIALAGRIALHFYQRFLVLQLCGLIFLSM